MFVIYPGPFDAVVLDQTVVEQGDSIEVSETVAELLAAQGWIVDDPSETVDETSLFDNPEPEPEPEPVPNPFEIQLSELATPSLED